MILRWWQELSDLGIYKDIPFAEKVRIRLSNQITVITSLLGFLYFLIDFFFLPQADIVAQVWVNVFHVSITFYWIPILLTFLYILGIYNMYQTKHAILRNFPVIGYFRFIFEGISPEIQ